MDLLTQPNEEPMKNKEEKAEAPSLASRKASRKPATFLFSYTCNQLLA